MSVATFSPFTGARHFDVVTDGRFLDEIIAAVPGLPDRFQRFGVVMVEQAGRIREMPRHVWASAELALRIRLKPLEDKPVRVYLSMAPAGGGGSKGKKSLLAIVATVALLAVGTFITGGGLAIGGLFAAGSMSAQLLAAGVTFVGRLALSLAAKPAGRSNNEAAQAGLGSASVTGNTVTPGQSFDYVAGRVKIYPKMASFPLVELDGEDEFVEACYMLEGPHEIRNARVEGTAVTEIPGLSFLADDGTNPRPQRLLSRFGAQETPQLELKAHLRDKTSPRELANQGAPESCLPQPAIFTTKHDPDEIWLQLLWPTNFGLAEGGGSFIMPFRLKLRIQGTDTWINLPELMFHSNTTGKMSKKIVLKWQAAAPTISDAPLLNGAWHSFHTVPAQTLPPAGGGAWAAHAGFNGGGGIYNNTVRVERRNDGFIVYLDPAVFLRGNRWDVSVQRGCITSTANWCGSGFAFDPVAYTPTVGSNVNSLFEYWNFGGGSTLYTGNGNSTYSTSTVEACMVLRFASVWNRKPLPRAGNAAIEVRGRNINVGRLSVEAAALVKCWNGTGFESFGPSENPADHYYEIATGDRVPNALRPHLVDVPLLGQWHAENVAAGRKVALILSGRPWEDSLDAVAAAGLARRREGRLLGVRRSRDTEALAVPARQVFSHLNMQSLNWTKSFATVPDAVRVSFRNRALDFDQDERVIIRPGLTAADVTLIVQQETDAIADVAQLETFWKLYLNSAWHRDHLFTLETWFEGVACEPGDIVLVNHLVLEETHAAARITEVFRDGAGDVTGLALDCDLEGNAPQGLQAAGDLKVIEDLRLQGLLLGAVIMTGAGVTTQPLATVNAGDSTITFSAPFINDDVAEGQMVSIGRRGVEAKRFEVMDIDPTGERFFTLTLAPEAPEMWSFS